MTVPPGEVVYSSRAAGRVAEEIGGQRWVVKAQIHAGGRGKAGGVKSGGLHGGVAELADQMLGLARWSRRRPVRRGSSCNGCSSSARPGSSGSSTSP